MSGIAVEKARMVESSKTNLGSVNAMVLLALSCSFLTPSNETQQ